MLLNTSRPPACYCIWGSAWPETRLSLLNSVIWFGDGLHWCTMYPIHSFHTMICTTHSTLSTLSSHSEACITSSSYKSQVVASEKTERDSHIQTGKSGFQPKCSDPRTTASWVQEGTSAKVPPLRLDSGTEGFLFGFDLKPKRTLKLFVKVAAEVEINHFFHIVLLLDTFWWFFLVLWWLNHVEGHWFEVKVELMRC